MLSKFILWIGFLLSSLFLLLILLVANNPKPFPLLLWSVIFLGSGYKLFFAHSKK